jgi:hypothetical protein
MPLQAPRRTGVELQSNAEGEVVVKLDAGKQDGEQDDELNGREKESVGNSAVFEPVDTAVADDPISRANRIENRIRDTGLQTVRSLVNGGLALFALGALSPVGLILKHLDDMKTAEGQNEVGSRDNDSEGEENLEDGDDL